MGNTHYHFNGPESKSNQWRHNLMKAGEVYAYLQMCPVPIKVGEKKPVIEWGELDFTHYFTKVLPYLERGCQLGIILDPRSSLLGSSGTWSLCVLDCDFDPQTCEKDLQLLMNIINEQKGIDGSYLSSSIKVKTGSGRLHIYFLMEIPTDGNINLPHRFVRREGVILEVRFGKQYVLVPPSLHPSAFQKVEGENGESMYVLKPDWFEYTYRYLLDPEDIDPETGLPLVWVDAYLQKNTNIFETLQSCIVLVTPENLRAVGEKWVGENRKVSLIVPTRDERIEAGDLGDEWDGNTVKEIQTSIMRALPRLTKLDDSLAFTVATQVSPYWKEGTRQNLSLSFVGYIVKRLPPKPIVGAFAVKIFEHITTLTNDPELSRRRDTITYTVANFLAGKTIKGYTGLKELLGDSWEAIKPVIDGVLEAFAKHHNLKIRAPQEEGNDSKGYVPIPLTQLQRREVEWLTEGILAKGWCVIVSGKTKSGKTKLCSNWAYALATGKTFFNGKPCKRSKVLYLPLDRLLDIEMQLFPLASQCPDTFHVLSDKNTYLYLRGRGV